MDSNARSILQRELGFYKRAGWRVVNTYDEKDFSCAELTHPKADPEHVLTIFTYPDGERVYRGPWFEVDQIHGKGEPPPKISPSEIPERGADIGTIVLVLVGVLILTCLACVLLGTIGPMVLNSVKNALTSLPTEALLAAS